MKETNKKFGANDTPHNEVYNNNKAFQRERHFTRISISLMTFGRKYLCEVAKQIEKQIEMKFGLLINIFISLVFVCQTHTHCHTLYMHTQYQRQAGRQPDT